ncbi:S9 family peptidase [Acidianus brierleyi]|uniref:S9 family peptidase n=1 Tax=Acidianus brierleyi TaxID=41673 RepID=A0A2U9IBC6_9CREN|nr:S9 family peptidase [Acidianus brierleyi]AWR93304.1 alpha/beta fold hydrolase [Acidianus brierleyi]
MQYQDLFKIKPITNYDVKDGRVAFIREEDIPRAYILGEGRIDSNFYAEEVSWINEKKLAVVGDPKGSEKREIYIFEGSLSPILKDEYDNVNPWFITDDKFYFLSNRESNTIHLFLYEGGEINRLSEGNIPVDSFCVSEDGKKVAYSQGIYDQDLHILEVDKWREEIVSLSQSEEFPASSQCFTRDGILFISNKNNYFDIGIFNNGDIKWLKTSNHEKYEALYFNDKLVYIEDNFGDFNIIKDDKIIVSEGYNRNLYVDGNYLYYLGSNYDRFSDLYRVDKDGNIERLTNSMEGISGNFVRPKKVEYKSFDGVNIPSLLYSKGNETKGVVYIHGGPDWECVNTFSPTIQFLVDAGFKVICPNYRGSTGYGRKFNHLNDKDLGGGDLKDVIHAAKFLNLNKIAVTGASYGGYLTMMAVTKYPDIWCSAVAVVPFVNWFTERQFEREFLQQYDEIKMGNDHNLLVDRSPIFFIDNIKTPLMILAGEYDPRCPAEETEQVVKKLKEKGVEIEYKIYENEGHGFAKIENYVDSIRNTVEFIKKCK